MVMNKATLDQFSEQQKRPNYYQILGCDRWNTAEQITVEYKRKVLECHPDKSRDDATAAAARFNEIKTAYNVLSNPKDRALYDIFLGTGLLVPFEIWKREHETHGSIHWQSSLPPTPQLSHGSSKPAERTSESSVASGKTLLQQFRDYDL